MQREKLLTAVLYLTRIRETSARDHVYRLRLANKVRKLVDDFIATEVQAAVNEARSDPAHMSWQNVADVLEISKTAAFARYGNKERVNEN